MHQQYIIYYNALQEKSVWAQSSLNSRIKGYVERADERAEYHERQCDADENQTVAGHYFSPSDLSDLSDLSNLSNHIVY